MPTFNHLWQQEEHSDIDIVLTAPQHGSGAAEEGTCKLAAFPGHGILLSDSPFFKAQILRWQNKRQQEEAFDATAQVSPASSSSRRPQLVLTLEDAGQQPAALAVLHVLYCSQPGSGLLSELTQEQQLQAALLADMWQVPTASTAAADVLAAAADGQLSEAVTHRLISIQALPVCLEPLLKKVLLSVFGDLEAVWADDVLQQRLLGLPWHAMEVLLSYDELKVASEDTVLYTARRYARATTEPSAMLLELLPDIRCPHLSLCWLAVLQCWLGRSRDPALEMLSKELLPPFSSLLVARIAQADYQMTAQDLQTRFAGAPACWALPQRAIQPVGSVQMTWQLPIDKLRAAAQRSVADSLPARLDAPSLTPPINGVPLSCAVVCKPNEGSCSIGVFVSAQILTYGVCMPLGCTVCIPSTQLAKTTVVKHNELWGWSDFFGVPPMVGGWDELAWAAKGLPTSGSLPIHLTVYEQPQPPAADNAAQGQAVG